MRKTFIAALLFVCCGIVVFAQAKPRLGILPFAGGTEGDGETIANLFSFEDDIMNAFTVVPRDRRVNALVAEQNFQMSGYTDSDTIADIGKMLNADFVVSGHIRRLGNRNLIITTIINVETFEMMAGDYREYGTIERVEIMLPAIAKKMIDATGRDTRRLPKLAVAPFRIANQGADAQAAEVLAQILSVEITNTGKYAVLPRTTAIQAALGELNFQMSGYTTEEGAKRVGAATNAQYVLNAEARNLGTTNMFTASILHVEDGSLLTGNSRRYQTITDGITLMAELARLLTDKVGMEAETQERARIAAEEAQTSERRARAKFWSIGVLAGTSVADPWVIGTIRATIAPFPYSFLEIGLDAGFISDVEDAGYWSLYPFAHYALYLPFTNKFGWYVGVGGGFMIEEYRIEEWTHSGRYWAVDVTSGFNLWNVLNISYTMRTNFSSANHKASVGFTYRF
jgi:TolB-like protein